MCRDPMRKTHSLMSERGEHAIPWRLYVSASASCVVTPGERLTEPDVEALLPTKIALYYLTNRLQTRRGPQPDV